MQRNKIVQFIIFFGTFIFFFLIPKPDLRIMKFKHEISQFKSETLIIGNSILEHQSGCEVKNKSVRDLFPGIAVLGEGGLLLEEIDLASAKTPYKNLILVLSTYNFYQPLYYPVQTHFFYRDLPWINNDKHEYPYVKKNLWRLDEVIKVQNDKIKRSEASAKIKQFYIKKHCAEIDWQKIKLNDLLESINNHSHNNYLNSRVSLNIISELNKQFNLKILIVPIWTGNEVLSIGEKNKYEHNITELTKKLNNLEVNYEVVNVGNKLSNYDEPWCLCGHLSSEGRLILLKSLKNSISDIKKNVFL
jgi:hypothetical protein